MDKKHEDVAMVAQIDKTSVFQEGMRVLSKFGESFGMRIRASEANSDM